MKRLLILPILLITAAQAELWDSLQHKATQFTTDMKNHFSVAKSWTSSKTQTMANQPYSEAVGSTFAFFGTNSLIKRMLGQTAAISWKSIEFRFRHLPSAVAGAFTGWFINQYKKN